ncbi:Crp/Fnr family transcriptional regulator [Terrimonas pollutisoli]|uniref:Crp/Fnr family transcriptional regulator n=1 Tax=Terrimonas pollutisoli TaxID=3034147 RepID=UPI0023ECF8F2|nr:cyclic nucleotide-binding domain-containing protein [Terrimonas sp. H1YJ31]
METLLEYLSSIHPMSQGLINYLGDHLKARQLSKRNYLLKAGHICRTVCFIEKGLLRCFYIKGDSEVCSWFMKEGNVIFSIESFYQQKASYESIQALEDTTVLFITYEELNHIYKTFSEFNFVGRVLTEKYYTLWAQQLYALRMQQAHERYKWLMDNHPELILRVPAKYIASYLSIDETTLSKIKNQRKK